jgi:hypothetical protein
LIQTSPPPSAALENAEEIKIEEPNPSPKGQERPITENPDIEDALANRFAYCNKTFITTLFFL